MASTNTPNKLDILYYSNYCKHSQQILNYIVKQNMIEKVSCICIDKRSRDANNNQMYVTLENGQKVALPPGIHSVPTLLQVTKNYTTVLGVQPILEIFQNSPKYNPISSPQSNNPIHPETDTSEPSHYDTYGTSSFGNIFSEKFTDYGLSPEALSTKGVSKERKLYNYVPVNSNITIPTPEEKYKPDKISSDLTIDQLQTQREIPLHH